MTAIVPYRVGDWLPSDQEFLGRWLGGLIARVESKDGKELLPVVDDFRQLVEDDPTLYMLFSAMLTQVPYKFFFFFFFFKKTVGYMLVALVTVLILAAALG